MSEIDYKAKLPEEIEACTVTAALQAAESQGYPVGATIWIAGEKDDPPETMCNDGPQLQGFLKHCKFRNDFDRVWTRPIQMNKR